MRAFVIDAYKKPVHEAAIPEPVVGDTDVLIQVAAVGLNILDEKVRAGEFTAFLPYPTPLVLGHDVAGTVIGIGTAVHSFAVGDTVFARVRDHRIGTLTERIAADEADVALSPASVTLIEAASLPLVALTAWQALIDKGGASAGQRVLIHAGAGGVGSIAIQLAKHLGAFVATTTSGKNVDFVRSLGADLVIDYQTQNFGDELTGYDFVLDSLGGENLATSLRVLRPGGKAIGIAGPPTPEFAREIGMNPLLRLGVGAISRSIRAQAKKLDVSYEFLFMWANGAQLRQIADLVDAGTIRPIVGATYSFDHTPEALAALHVGGIRGKSVVIGAEATDS